MVASNDHVGMCTDPSRYLIRIWSIAHDVAEAENRLVALVRCIAQNSAQGLPIRMDVTQYQKTQGCSRVVHGHAVRVKAVVCHYCGETDSAGKSLVWSGMASAIHRIPRKR